MAMHSNCHHRVLAIRRSVVGRRTLLPRLTMSDIARLVVLTDDPTCMMPNRAPLERFLDRQIDAPRALLADPDVETQVRLRALVNQQAKAGAAAGGEAIEELLAAGAVVTVVVFRNATMPEQPVARQRPAVFNFAVAELFTAKLPFAISAGGTTVRVETGRRQIEERRHAPDDKVGEEPEGERVPAFRARGT